MARRSSTLTALGAVTRADSVARLTEALTPSSLFSFFSTRATQLAQVMPPMERLTVRSCPPDSWLVVLMGAFCVRCRPVLSAGVRCRPSAPGLRAPTGHVRAQRSRSSRSTASSV